MTKSDALIAIEVHRLYNELRPLLGSDAKRGLLDSLHRLVYTPPTMADIAWDDEVHAGLCALFFDGELVRMIGPDLDNEGVIFCHYINFGSPVTGGLSAKNLTPLPGTRVDLTPRRESFSNEGVETGNEDRNEGVMTGRDHPVTLSSVEDYESAPVGTIAADDDGVAVKVVDGTWRWTGSESAYNSDDLCYGESDPMTVVRWGK